MKYIIYEKSAYDVHSEWMVVLCRLYTMVTLPQPLQNQRRFCTRSFYYAIYRNPRTGCTDGILYFDKMKLFFSNFLDIETFLAYVGRYKTEVQYRKCQFLQSFAKNFKSASSSISVQTTAP